MLKVEIPNSKDKIEKQILALEYIIEENIKNGDIKDEEIHRNAVHELRKALEKMK